MIIDFETIDNDSVFDADLCIVGAGASGITMALEFANSVKRVILVESGSFGVNDAYESLNAGEVDGLAFVGLQGGRRRGLGGTTAAWGGQCCELDAADFSERAWLPDSGWPFPRAQLEPFYRRAEYVFNVSGERYDESNWRRFGLTPVPLGHEFLNTSFSVFSPHPRLGPFYRKALVAARNLHVVLGATVTNIRTNAACTSVEGVEVRSASGRRASVRARVIVLCTGTIESARLLLASRDVAPGGIGNDCDLVGRYLQDHPTADTATITGSDTRHLQEIYGLLYRGRTWYWPKLALAPALASRARALNASAFVMFEYDSPALEILRDIVRTTRTGGRLQLSASRIATLVAGTSSVVHAGYRRYLRGRSPQARPSKINLTCTIEQAPNRYSRVMLSSKRDTLGVPLPLVDWRLTGNGASDIPANYPNRRRRICTSRAWNRQRPAVA